MPATTAPTRRDRLRVGDDEGVALLLVVLTMTVVAAMSLLLLSVVLNQVKPTQLQQKTTRTVSAAQAGIDAALSLIRTAQAAPNVAGGVFGDPSLLPCSIAGTVGDNGDGVAYRATITYYNTNPVPLTQAQRADRVVACTQGRGTTLVPSHALIRAAATGSGLPGSAVTSGDRTLQSLYTFQIQNANVPGGLFYSVNQKWCLQAGSIAAGANVTYTAAANCVSANSLQTWIYHTDYTIILAASVLGGSPLCISAPNPSGTATLAVCNAKDLKQQWSYQGGAQFRNQVAADNGTANKSTNGGSCLSAASTAADLQASLLTSTTTCTNNSEYGSFSPEPKVGAGAASYATKQIVNFLEFGRCMDVTNGDINSSYMIIYPCKQDPSGGTLLNWNHKWYYDEPTGTATRKTGPIYVMVDNSTKYCLQTPVAGSSSSYVTFTSACDATNPRQVFTRTLKVPGDYASSYTFKDSAGKCLSVGPKQIPANNGVKWSTIVTAACTGGSEQKWNAEAGLVNAEVTDTREVTVEN